MGEPPRSGASSALSPPRPPSSSGGVVTRRPAQPKVLPRMAPRKGSIPRSSPSSSRPMTVTSGVQDAETDQMPETVLYRQLSNSSMNRMIRDALDEHTIDEQSEADALEDQKKLT